jgi:photosystem I subunit PsaO
VLTGCLSPFAARSWTIPSNIPVSAFGGQSLFGLFTQQIGAELAHFPVGPSIDSPFWLYMITWHMGLFACIFWCVRKDARAAAAAIGCWAGVGADDGGMRVLPLLPACSRDSLQQLQQQQQQQQQLDVHCSLTICMPCVAVCCIVQGPDRCAGQEAGLPELSCVS